jgi:hypothetical protein
MTDRGPGQMSLPLLTIYYAAEKNTGLLDMFDTRAFSHRTLQQKQLVGIGTPAFESVQKGTDTVF